MKKKETSLSDTEVLCTHFGDHVPCYSQPVYLKQAVRNAVSELREILESERKTTWEEDEEHSNNPIHQSDFIAMQKKIDEVFGSKLMLSTDSQGAKK